MSDDSATRKYNVTVYYAAQRTYYGIKTKAHPNGILFNVCPFCGEHIDAPFNPDEAAQ